MAGRLQKEGAGDDHHQWRHAQHKDPEHRRAPFGQDRRLSDQQKEAFGKQGRDHHHHGIDKGVKQRQTPDAAADVAFTGAFGLGDQDHRALQQSDAADKHDDLRCKAQAVEGQFLRRVAPGHDRVGSDHEQRACTVDHHRPGKCQRAANVVSQH